MVFEDTKNNMIIIPSPFGNTLHISLYSDDMSFDFMSCVNDVYNSDAFNWLKNNIYFKRMIVSTDLDQEEFLKLISILKTVIEARLTIGEIGQSEENDRISNIVVEKWNGFSGKPFYTIGIKVNDDISPRDAEFLVYELFDTKYNYNDVLKIVEQWEKLVESDQ